MAPLQRTKLTTVVFSIRASSVCAGEKQNNKRKVCEKLARFSLPWLFRPKFGGDRGRGACVAEPRHLQLASYLPLFPGGPHPVVIFGIPAPVTAPASLPGQSEIWKRGGEGRGGEHTQGRVRVREVRPGFCGVTIASHTLLPPPLISPPPQHKERNQHMD